MTNITKYVYSGSILENKYMAVAQKCQYSVTKMF